MSDLDPEMIEKVAIATYDAMQHPNWRAPNWDEIDEPGRERFLNAARAALEAVAPLIAAKALRGRTDRDYELVRSVDAELAKRGLGIDILWGASDDEYTVTREITERASWADS